MMDNVIPLNRKQLAGEAEEGFLAFDRGGIQYRPRVGRVHEVPRMHVLPTGAVHPEPAYFPAPDPLWSVTTNTSWVLGVLHAETGLECKVTWSDAGEDQWTLQMWPEHEPITGLTARRTWDMMGGAIMLAKAARAAKK